MLLKLFHVLLRSIFYVVITWYRFAPDGSSKPVRQSDGGSQAKRGA